MCRVLLAFFACVSLGFAPAPFLPRNPTPAEAELKALRGEWCQRAVVIDGKPERVTPAGAASVYAGDRLTVLHSGKIIKVWRVTVDASASPKVMTLVREWPRGGVEEVVRSRFRLEGDTLIKSTARKKDGLPGLPGGLELAKDVVHEECGLPGGLEPGEGVVVATYHRKRP